MIYLSASTLIQLKDAADYTAEPLIECLFTLPWLYSDIDPCCQASKVVLYVYTVMETI